MATRIRLGLPEVALSNRAIRANLYAGLFFIWWLAIAALAIILIRGAMS